MIKKLFSGLTLTALIGVAVYYLFELVTFRIVKPVDGADGSAVLIAELIFLAFGFFLYFVLVNFRLLALLSLLIGQLSLFFHDITVLVAGREFPIYGLIGINSFIFLILYFVFSAHLWAPDELDVEEFDP